MLYVAFSREDIIKFSSLVSAQDIILAFKDFIDVGDGEIVVDVSDVEVNWSESVALVRKLFHEFNQETGLDINGYANNFFECSCVVPLQYLISLKNYSLEHESVMFPSKLIGTGRVNYYMGEHESQGRLLYDRSFAMQCLLENAAHSYGLKVSSLGFRANIQRVNSLIRDSVVYSVRFLQAIRAAFLGNKAQAPNVKDIFDCCVVLRTSAQFSALKKVLESSANSVLVICATSFTQKNLFELVSSWGEDFDNVEVIKLPEANIKDTLSIYFSFFLHALRSSGSSFNIEGESLDMKQAFREVLIMAAEIELYKKRLDSFLPHTQRSVLFLTCEQKSPHAYTETKTAKRKGYNTVQIMACDQSSIDLPYPVVGDIYVTDTLKRKKLFEEGWSSQLDRLFYLGPLRKNDTLVEENNSTSDYDVCYFAHVSEIEQNKKVIKLLDELKKQHDSFNYCIKLHPRDRGGWLDEVIVGKENIFFSRNISNEELFSKFRIAISNPSAVVIELLSQCKPFVFLDSLNSYKGIDFVSCDQAYKGYVQEIGQLKDVLLGDYDLKQEVLALNKRVFGGKAEQVTLFEIMDLFRGRS